MHGGAISCPSSHRCRDHPLLMCDIDFLFVTGGGMGECPEKNNIPYFTSVHLPLRRAAALINTVLRNSTAYLLWWPDKNSQWYGEGPGSSVSTVTTLCDGWMTNMDYISVRGSNNRPLYKIWALGQWRSTACLQCRGFSWSHTFTPHIHFFYCVT